VVLRFSLPHRPMTRGAHALCVCRVWWWPACRVVSCRGRVVSYRGRVVSCRVVSYPQDVRAVLYGETRFAMVEDQVLQFYDSRIGMLRNREHRAGGGHVNSALLQQLEAQRDVDLEQLHASRLRQLSLSCKSPLHDPRGNGNGTASGGGGARRARGDSSDVQDGEEDAELHALPSDSESSMFGASIGIAPASSSSPQQLQQQAPPQQDASASAAGGSSASSRPKRGGSRGCRGVTSRRVLSMMDDAGEEEEEDDSTPGVRVMRSPIDMHPAARLF